MRSFKFNQDEQFGSNSSWAEVWLTAKLSEAEWGRRLKFTEENIKFTSFRMFGLWTSTRPLINRWVFLICLVASRCPFINLFWVVRFMLICLYLIRSRCLFGISYALYSDCTSSLSDYLYSSYSCHYFPKTEALMTWHDTFSNVTVMGSTHSLDVPQMLGSRTPPKLPVLHDWSSLPFSMATCQLCHPRFRIKCDGWNPINF